MKRRTFLTATAAAVLAPLVPAIAAAPHPMQPVLDYFKKRAAGAFGYMTPVMVTLSCVGHDSHTRSFSAAYTEVSKLPEAHVVLEADVLSRLGNIKEFDFYSRDHHRAPSCDSTRVARQTLVQSSSNWVANETRRGGGNMFIRVPDGYIVTYANQTLLGDAGMVFNDGKLYTHDAVDNQGSLESYFVMVKGDPDDILKTIKLRLSGNAWVTDPALFLA
jgi:hypothetical protein